MRIYLPLVVSDLISGSLPKVDAIEFDSNVSGMNAEELELLSEERLVDAGFASLQRSAEEDSTPARIVAVANVNDAGQEGVGWDQVESIMADSELGRELAARAVLAQTQEEADEMVERLFEEPLSWFDTSERLDLARQISGGINEV